MPIILLVVAAWLFILSIVNWFRTYGEVAAIQFVGTFMLVALAGVLSRLDALCRRFEADTRDLPIKKKPPLPAADEETDDAEPQAQPGDAAAPAGPGAPDKP